MKKIYYYTTLFLITLFCHGNAYATITTSSDFVSAHELSLKLQNDELNTPSLAGISFSFESNSNTPQKRGNNLSIIIFIGLTTVGLLLFIWLYKLRENAMN